MRKGFGKTVWTVLFFALCVGLFSGVAAAAEPPIVIGAPLATAFLYGWDAERGIRLAVEEINAAGGPRSTTSTARSSSTAPRPASPPRTTR